MRFRNNPIPGSHETWMRLSLVVEYLCSDSTVARWGEWMGSRALLMLDFINEIVHEDGKYGREGYAAQVRTRGVLENATAALIRARESNIAVIHVVVAFSQGYPEWPSNSPVFSSAREDGRLLLGSWGTRVHDSVASIPSEPVVVKHRISPFYATTLEVVLRSLAVDTLLLAGVATDMVVLAAARDGHDRGFHIEVLEDATAADSEEIHEAALRVIGRSASLSTVSKALGRGREE
ncbi:cysteine hydrolase [Rathayibacter rathayi]|nr:cysteine hydrolase [Rathayibacter rathayi]